LQYIQIEHSFLATVEKIKEVKPKETQKRKGGKADAPATKKAKEDAPTKPAENRKAEAAIAGGPSTSGGSQAAEPIRVNFAPGEKKAGSQNIVMWEGYIGNDWYIRYQKWLTNNQEYICIRKSNTQGANVPIENFWGLKAALGVLAQQCKGNLPEQPNQ
jgi:hypothetical protein